VQGVTFSQNMNFLWYSSESTYVPAISTQSIHRWKIHLMGYKSVADIRGLSIRLAAVGSKIAKSREIPTKFDLTAVQGHARLSILVSIECASISH